MKQIVLTAAAFLPFLPSSAQKETNFIDSVGATISAIKEELVPIKENYYVIQPDGFAANIGVYVGKAGIVLVDNQWAALAPRVKALVKTVTSRPVAYIINTHYHFDHVDGNKAFGKEAVPIIAHSNLRKRLSADRTISLGSGFKGLLQRAYPPEALPSITFSDSMTLHAGDETIRLLYFKNAHTDGDAVVHFKNADIYHTGDIFVTYGLPVVDENNGGDVYAMIDAVGHLLSVANSETRFIPGHGPVCSVKELAAYHALLLSIKNQVVELLKKGLSLEKILVNVRIDEKTGGVDRNDFISHVYRMALKHERFRSK